MAQEVPGASGEVSGGASSSSTVISPQPISGNGERVRRKAEDQGEDEIDNKCDVNINQVEALIDALVQKVRGAGKTDEDIEELTEAWDDVHGRVLPPRRG